MFRQLLSFGCNLARTRPVNVPDRLKTGLLKRGDKTAQAAPGSLGARLVGFDIIGSDCRIRLKFSLESPSPHVSPCKRVPLTR